MSKAYLTNAVSKTLDITAAKAEGYVETVINSIKQGVKEEGRLVIRGFGIFTSQNKNERMGRNPKTGEPVLIKARTVVKFSASKMWKDKLNQ